MDKMKTAIVTTLINASSVVEFFVQYHLHIGFDHIFLFFDDPADPSSGLVEKDPNVTLILNDAALKEKWENTRLFKANRGYCDYIGNETMARQLLNTEIANDMAVQMGISWLLHIDIDELFYFPDHDVKTHFSELDRKSVV